MKRIFFTCFVLMSFVYLGQAQDDGQDIQKEIDKISTQMEEMLNSIEGPLMNSGIFIDTLFFDSFEELKRHNLGGIIEVDPNNMDESLEQLMDQFQIQIKSLTDQDWDAVKELFEQFGGAFQMPDSSPRNDQEPSNKKTTKSRKTTDL